jgi:hypothetical protein
MAQVVEPLLSKHKVLSLNPIRMILSWAPMAYICNPSYSGGRGLQFKASPRQIVLKTLSWKKPITNKGLV